MSCFQKTYYSVHLQKHFLKQVQLLLKKKGKRRMMKRKRRKMQELMMLKKTPLFCYYGLVEPVVVVVWQVDWTW